MGKLLIIHFILEAEKKHYEENKTSRTDLKDDWYSYLFKKMMDFHDNYSDSIQIQENNLGIITFNYDRSLEYYFNHKFKAAYGGESRIYDTSELIMKYFPIHVYGKVANNYKDEDNETVGELRYGHYIPNYSLLDFLKTNIKLVMERKKVDTNIIKEKIKKARRIYFLGFGFDDANLKILGIPEILNKKQEILGTAYGMGNGEINLVRAKFLVKHNVKKVSFKPIKCLELLKKYPPDYNKEFLN